MPLSMKLRKRQRGARVSAPISSLAQSLNQIQRRRPKKRTVSACGKFPGAQAPLGEKNNSPLSAACLRGSAHHGTVAAAAAAAGAGGCGGLRKRTQNQRGTGQGAISIR